jgi:hypothetical protein
MNLTCKGGRQGPAGHCRVHGHFTAQQLHLLDPTNHHDAEIPPMGVCTPAYLAGTRWIERAIVESTRSAAVAGDGGMDEPTLQPRPWYV